MDEYFVCFGEVWLNVDSRDYVYWLRRGDRAVTTHREYFELTTRLGGVHFYHVKPEFIQQVQRECVQIKK